MSPALRSLQVWIERSRLMLEAHGIEAIAGTLEPPVSVDALRLARGGVMATYVIHPGPPPTTEMVVNDRATGTQLAHAFGAPRRSADIEREIQSLVSDLRDGRYEAARAGIAPPTNLRARIRTALHARSGPMGIRVQDMIAGALTWPVFLAVSTHAGGAEALLGWGLAAGSATLAMELLFRE